jgi:hypothetical protein
MAHTRRSEDDSDASSGRRSFSPDKATVDLRPSVSLGNRRREIMINYLFTYLCDGGDLPNALLRYY